MVFNVSNRVFLNLLLLALFGREKEVSDLTSEASADLSDVFACFLSPWERIKSD
jgi:hypothetical protein